MQVVEGYDFPITLRMVYYVLLGEHWFADGPKDPYKGLSREVAKARRAGRFPRYVDPTREIARYQSWTSPTDAQQWLRRAYRRDRTEDQEVALYIAAEKNATRAALLEWFGELGIPVLALRGFASQPYVEAVAEDVERDGRPAVLVYAGDFDSSGEDIDRDFLRRTGCFKAIRVALSREQVEHYGLPVLEGNSRDSRAKAFVQKYGSLMQVEIEALPPDILHGLYREAVKGFWDAAVYETVLREEERERGELP